jgi:hypothetical protein
MWIELLNRLTSDCKFSTPATQIQISAAESALNIKFPDELCALLLESNGVKERYECDLIWPVERVQADNLIFRSKKSFRKLYMPFDSLLFFCDSGSGDQFAFAIHDGVIRRPDVFVWDHEDDSRTWVAPSLEKYLEWSFEGRIRY